MNTRPTGYQWVWWGFGEMAWGFKRLDPDETDLALIYEWLLCLGPLEIRKWAEKCT